MVVKPAQRRQRFRIAAWISCAVVAWFAGCQQETPTGYHTFRESEDSRAADEITADDEPLIAEVSPEDDSSPQSWDVPASALEPLNIVDGTNVADLLRTVPSNATKQPADSATAGGQPIGPRKVELLVKHREFRPEGSQHALRVTYDDLDLLKVLNMDPVMTNAAELMPDWLRKLDGQEVRIRGFMRPTYESSGLEQFVMARDAALCCFGANPKVYDLIAVEMKPGTTCDYIHLRPFDVIGRFKIDPLADGDKLLALYWIEDAQIVTK